jgi:tRNA threonylcarbamoyladenosine biosynthesis protein TsaB
LSRPFLALDSSTQVGSAAVGDESGVLAEMVVRVVGGHSGALLPAVDEVMRAAGLRPGDLAGVVVGGGPGSFTGLRIAAATAKGIRQALGVPLYAYSGLLAAAAAGWAAEGTVCALFDARRRDVYAACYRFTEGARPVEVLMAPTALSVDELVARLAEAPPALLVGEGAVMHRAELEERLGSRVAPPQLAIPRASSLLWLAARVPELGRVEEGAAWEPEYVRASGAERIAAEGRL